MDGEYPGHKVQVDIKYVPNECIKFPCYGQQYYQITAIDEYSRRRILKIVKEKSTYETGKFLQSLEKKMGFKVSIIQVDNGAEFVNDAERTDKTWPVSENSREPGDADQKDAALFPMAERQSRAFPPRRRKDSL